MTKILFPDNTVLVNFALINRMDLLDRVVNGRGRWCATVASECARSARRPGLNEMVQADGIFGAPLYPETGAEHLDVRAFQLELAQPGDAAYKHLGEAETLAIMIRRSIVGLFVTDDKSATALARRYGVTTVSTWDLLRLAVRCEFVDQDTLWSYVRTLRQKQRGHPEGVTDRTSFTAWLK